MKHNIFIVRHGESIANVTGEILPHEINGLTEYGEKQVMALADHLKKDVSFTLAFTSDYERALGTAKILLRNDSSRQLNVDKRLRERDMGFLLEIDGRKEEIARALEERASGKSFNEIEIAGSESLAEYVERIASFFKELFRNLRNSENSEAVLIVTHGLLITRFFQGLNDGTFDDVCKTKDWTEGCAVSLANASYTSLSLEFPEQGIVPHASEYIRPLVKLEKIRVTTHLEKL